MLISALIVIWLFCGYIGWQEQMKKIDGFSTTYDYAMLGPMMVLGPIGLWIVTR